MVAVYHVLSKSFGGASHNICNGKGHSVEIFQLANIEYKKSRRETM